MAATSCNVQSSMVQAVGVGDALTAAIYPASKGIRPCRIINMHHGQWAGRLLENPFSHGFAWRPAEAVGGGALHHSLRHGSGRCQQWRRPFITSAVSGSQGSGATSLVERTSLPMSGPLAPPQWVVDAVAEQPWKGGLEATEERSYTVDPSLIEGTIPDDLRGCLYTCGPGRIRIGGKKYGHWFDGDGMVSAIRFNGSEGKVEAGSRFVRTDKFKKQEKAGSDRIAPKGAWTSPDGWLNKIGIPANPVNTSMLAFAGKVYALCEAGRPMGIDPETLETVGFTDFTGPGGDSLGSAAFSAHFKIDPDSGVLYNMGVDQTDFSCAVYAISPDGELLKKSSFANDKLVIVHDMAMSKNHIAFIVSPYEAEPSSILKVLLGMSTYGEHFKWVEDRGTRVVIMSREDLSIKLDTIVEGPSFSTYHSANAFEEDGKLHLIICRLKGPREVLESYFSDMYGSSWQAGGYNELWEIVWDLDTWQIVSNGPAFKPAPGNPVPFGMEFPVVNPNYIGKRHRYMYATASSGASARADGAPTAHQLDSLQKYDFQSGELQTLRFPRCHYASEAEFVLKSSATSEDDGYLIVNVYNPSRHGTDTYVLDAKNIEAPPLCKIALPSHIPLYFHGFWVPK